MGYATVFWVREEPIRRCARANGCDNTLATEVGKRVLSFSRFERADEFANLDGGLPLFDAPSVFFPIKTYHSTDFSILVWMGSGFERLGQPSPATFDSFFDHAAKNTTDMVLPLSRKEYYEAIGGGQWRNELDKTRDVFASVFWIYEDFTRNFTRQPEAKWPCKELGTAVLSLMFSTWSKSEPVLNHGNAVHRCSSFLRQDDFGVFVWSLNCLRPLLQIEQPEIQSMREYLAGLQ